MISYYLVAPFLYLLAYLPTGMLYSLADVMAFALRVIIGYRKKVVETNIRKSFPEKSEKEITVITKEFYHHLAYRVVENIKCIAISPEEVERRVKVINPEVLEDLYRREKNVVFMIGHIGAWEYCTYRLRQVCNYHLLAIASRVHNPYFDRLIQRTRGKMGMNLVHMQNSAKFFRERQPQLSLVVFVSDQSPSTKEKAYWTTFLNQPTGFFKGGERYAVAHECAVVYPMIKQISRGRYSVELFVLSDNASTTNPGEITEKFAQILEQHILQHPADWLWSHKRWKHKPITDSIIN